LRFSISDFPFTEWQSAIGNRKS